MTDQVNRREALLGLSGAAMMTWGRAVHAQLASRPAAANDPTLARLAELIIPATQTPGAIGAGVPEFITLVLAEWCSPKERADVLAGLKDLSERSDSFEATVRALDEAAALARRSANSVDHHWFALFKYLTLWGYYTSRVGVTEELRIDLMPGRYDGNAPYER